jgi:ABC-type phosphate/phosphonate transport system substrate-binding protein
MISALRYVLVSIAAIFFAGGLASADTPATDKNRDGSINMIVMDPLSAPLACDCVKGYANRQYQRLSEHLEKELKTEVRIFWSESLAEALKEKASGNCDLVIGKHSVVTRQAKIAKHNLIPVASLTDQEGSTTQRGLFVVKSMSLLATVLDLEGAEILFGPEDCDEKWKAPREHLKNLEIPFSVNSTVETSCSTAAKKLMEFTDDAKVAAVVSSYATPLLEGCGTIRKGDLRIIGETDAVPFIVAFVDEQLSDQQRKSIQNALLTVKDPDLLKALESAKGFTAYHPD